LYCEEFKIVAQKDIFPNWDNRRFYFFLLDPCGWSDVTMEIIRCINSHNKTEILFTYMVDHIRRFAVSIQRPLFDKIFEAQGYFEKPFRNYEVDHEQQYFRNETIRLFRDKGKAKFVFTFALISDQITKTQQKDLKRDPNRVLYYLIHLSNHERAVEVMKESFAKEKNLIYQFYFEVYGYAFRSSEFYEKEQGILRFDDIDVTDDSFCINLLEPQVTALIESKPEGIPYGTIRRITVEKNPSLEIHYKKLLCQLRDNGDIEILRKDRYNRPKRTNAYDLSKDDIVRMSRKFQTNLFFTSKFGC